MEKKNSFNITIAGKSYALYGNESKEYLKRVGSYIENKYNTYAKEISFRTQPMDMQHILMQLNIADDYMKSQDELVTLKRRYGEQALELEKLQSSFVALQVKYDNLEQSTKLLEKKYQQAKEKLFHNEQNQ